MAVNDKVECERQKDKTTQATTATPTNKLNIFLDFLSVGKLDAKQAILYALTQDYHGTITNVTAEQIQELNENKKVISALGLLLTTFQDFFKNELKIQTSASPPPTMTTQRALSPLPKIPKQPKVKKVTKKFSTMKLQPN